MRVGDLGVGGDCGGARGGLSLDGGWERWVRRRRRDVVFVEVRRVSRQDVKWSWMDERMVCVVGVERNGRFEDRHGEWSWWGTWFVVEEGWGEDVSLTVVFCVIVDLKNMIFRFRGLGLVLENIDPKKSIFGACNCVKKKFFQLPKRCRNSEEGFARS